MGIFIPLLCKDSARRAQCERKKRRFFLSIAEPPPILSKDSARRAQCERKKRRFFLSIAEPPPVLSKDSARRAQCERKKRRFFLSFSDPPPVLSKNGARHELCKENIKKLFAFCHTSSPFGIVDKRPAAIGKEMHEATHPIRPKQVCAFFKLPERPPSVVKAPIHPAF